MGVKPTKLNHFYVIGSKHAERSRDIIWFLMRQTITPINLVLKLGQPLRLGESLPEKKIAKEFQDFLLVTGLN